VLKKVGGGKNVEDKTSCWEKKLDLEKVGAKKKLVQKKVFTIKSWLEKSWQGC
jgi:hypothetical protein